MDAGGSDAVFQRSVTLWAMGVGFVAHSRPKPLRIWAVPSRERAHVGRRVRSSDLPVTECPHGNEKWSIYRVPMSGVASNDGRGLRGPALRLLR